MLAGRNAFSTAFKDAGPKILEPIYDVKIFEFIRFQLASGMLGLKPFRLDAEHLLGIFLGVGIVDYFSISTVYTY